MYEPMGQGVKKSPANANRQAAIAIADNINSAVSASRWTVRKARGDDAGLIDRARRRR